MTTTNHHVATFGGTIIGEAASKEEAIRVCLANGFTVIPEVNGGNIDFYDAKDGPGVQGYEVDGKGIWIVACEE